MLWCESSCFVHYPAAEGVTVARLLEQIWPAPVQGSDVGAEASTPTLQQGLNHESLAEALGVIQQSGADPRLMQAILVSVRNPYEQMFDLWRLSQSGEIKPDAASQRRFAEFCQNARVLPVEAWLTLGGETPWNLRVIRFECAEEDIRHLALEFGWEELPATSNRSSAPAADTSWRGWLNADAEQAIHSHFRFLFDNGYYPREQSTDLIHKSA